MANKQNSPLPITGAGPRFSVIIPAYNAENFLQEALDSVKNQTFSDYEIVVVDDGSTDSTPQLVKAWAASHLQIKMRLITQENKGIGGARNAGMREAQGQFIAFLDADDIWLPRKLELVAQCLDRSPDIDLICHDEWLFENGRNRSRFTYGPHTAYEDLLFKQNSLSTSATVVRRKKVLETGGFSEDLHFNSVEDYDLWLRLSQSRARIAYLHEVLGAYRVHGGGITSRIEHHCANGLHLLEAHFAQWPRNTFYYRYLMRRRRSDTYRGAARACLKSGALGEARRYLRLALKADPFSWKAWVLTALTLAGVKI
jgi:glycosyltransferase involved in cell wall biosynthesis